MQGLNMDTAVHVGISSLGEQSDSLDRQAPSAKYGPVTIS